MNIKTTNWRGVVVEMPLESWVSAHLQRGEHGRGELEDLRSWVDRMSDIVGKLVAERVKTAGDLEALGIYLPYGTEVVE